MVHEIENPDERCVVHCYQHTTTKEGKTMTKIEWTGSNNSTFLNGAEPAKTILGAVRAAIKYGNGALMGEGKLTILEDGEPVREYVAGMIYGTKRFDWTRITK